MRPSKPRTTLPLVSSFFAFLSVVTFVTVGCAGSSVTARAGRFTKTDLVADTAIAGTITDPNLVNPWGMSYSPSGPFWVSDNATGLVTVYNGAGSIQSLVVTIPGAGGAAGGSVTGQVYNSTTDFVMLGLGPSKFLFVTEDGVLSSWYAGTSAVLQNDQSSTGAIYKGLAIGSNGSANFLYATNFHSGQIDVFDTSFALVNSFTDPSIPTGYAPFGIQTINGKLYVTYALQDGAKEDDVPGAGHGYVDVFNMDGTVSLRLISNGSLNSPWGLAVAPAGFGSVSNALLVGNFGDGRIIAYNLTTGAEIGRLNDSNGDPIVIPGLWGLLFGNGGSAGSTGELFFTAGPSDETHGLFGKITPIP